jgi:hypothetical protein
VHFCVGNEERKKIMAWTLTGELVETWSCNMLCPCWYGVKELMLMDRGWCASPILFRIRHGNADGVDLSGINVVFAGFFPGPTLYDGNGTARLYVDDAISEAQQQALEAIMHGKQGVRRKSLADSYPRICQQGACQLLCRRRMGPLLPPPAMSGGSRRDASRMRQASQ